MLVLEREADARRRGATILGELLGHGNAMETADCIEPVGSEATVREAWRQATAGVPIDFIIAHGIGKPDADRREAAILSAIFGSDIPVTALKSQTGYLGAATAAVELAMGLLAARHGYIPPIARHEAAPADCPLRLAAVGPRPIDNQAPVFLLLNWSWTGQCTALLMRAFRS